MTYGKPKAKKLSISVSGEMFQWLEAHKRPGDRGVSNIIQQCIESSMGESTSVSPLDNDAFTQLVLDFNGGLYYKAEKLAKTHNLPQGEFINHLLNQSIQALQGTRPGDSWKDIRCIPPHLEVFEKNFEQAAEEPPEKPNRDVPDAS